MTGHRMLVVQLGPVYKDNNERALGNPSSLHSGSMHCCLDLCIRALVLVGVESKRVHSEIQQKHHVILSQLHSQKEEQLSLIYKNFFTRKTQQI